MSKRYNALNDVPINYLELGMCPVCARRLASECEHRSENSEEWYAAQILAEQELHNDRQIEPLPFIDLSAKLSVYISPKVARFM